ncbi:MAG: ROK family protein, partial [Chthoniobacterales bacterium]
MRKILVVDIGGTTVKMMLSRSEKRKFNSGAALTPRQLTTKIKQTTADWKFDAIAIGFPAPVSQGKIIKEPTNLGKGWVGWDFKKLLGKPTRVINDAALQALGSYRGGRMLFLGLGTGLGSTFIWDKNIFPLELGHLPYGDGNTIEEHLGKRGLERFGRKVWEREVFYAITQLKTAFIADYVMLGGGNAKMFKKLPAGVEFGSNRNVYLGGCRLWQ